MPDKFVFNKIMVQFYDECEDLHDMPWSTLLRASLHAGRPHKRGRLVAFPWSINQLIIVCGCFFQGLVKIPIVTKYNLGVFSFRNLPDLFD